MNRLERLKSTPKARIVHLGLGVFLIAARRAAESSPRCSSTNLNLMAFGSRKTALLFLDVPLVLSRTWLLCDTGAVAQHGIYVGQRRGSDRFPLGRDGPWRGKVALCGSTPQTRKVDWNLACGTHPLPDRRCLHR